MSEASAAIFQMFGEANAVAAAAAIAANGGARALRQPSDYVRSRLGNQVPVAMRSAGPADNPAVIRNSAEFLQRHRNANIRMCFTASKPAHREGANKVFHVRTVNDTGREGSCSANMHVGEPEPIVEEPSLYQDVPRGLAPSALAAMPRIAFTASMDAAQCPICFCDLEVGDNVVITECAHKIHADGCATQWFDQSVQCPQCRNNCGPSINAARSVQNARRTR
jgi:hypothetical protein